MIIALYISITLNLLILILFFWLKKNQQENNYITDFNLKKVRKAYNALMGDLNNYQAKTDRKIIELQKQIEVEKNTRVRHLDNFKKDLPNNIRNVIGHIEFAQNNLR
tara:strand:+ start:265 stop:585 length:321 start_codon:yes stop_codon:yes gene_type:complete